MDKHHLIGIVAVTLLTSHPAFAGGSQLDGTFSADGTAFTDVAELSGDTGSAEASGVAVGPDGRIVAVGTLNYSDWAIVRYTSRGVRDLTFSGDGMALLRLGDGWTRFAAARDVVVQPDHKIVVVGSAPYGSYNGLLVARFLPDGRLDTSFSGDGLAYFVTSLSSVSSISAAGVALQSDGKIAVAGTVHLTDGRERIIVLRFLPTGGRDTSFGGGDGYTWSDLGGSGSSSERANDLALDAYGRYVVAGDDRDNGDIVVARYTADGYPDASWDGDGIAHTGAGQDWGASVAIQGAARVIVSGTCDNPNWWGCGGMIVARFLANGTLDKTFDGDGKVTYDFEPGYTGGSGAAVIYHPTLQKIIVAGDGGNPLGGRWHVVRLNLDGSFDTTFGDNGVVHTQMSTAGEGARAMVLQADGKVLTAGVAWEQIYSNTFKGYFALARYVM